MGSTLYATEWRVGFAPPPPETLNCFAVINEKTYPVAFVEWIGAQALVQHANGAPALIPAGRLLLPTGWATPTGQLLHAVRELLSRRVGFTAVHLVVTARHQPPLPEVFFDFQRLGGDRRAYALALTAEAAQLYRLGRRIQEDRLLATWAPLPATELATALLALDTLDP